MPDWKLSQKVYDHLCRQLLSGKLSGGDRVSELALAKETGVSRSPVREALVRLRVEGLLEHIPKLGSSVHTTSRADFEELFRVSEWLEAGAAGALAGKPNTELLTRLQKLNDQILDVARVFYTKGTELLDAAQTRRLRSLDTEYHFALMEGTGNEFAMRTLVRAYMLIQVGRYRVERLNREHVARIYTDHDLVLRAIRRGDEAESGSLMARHVRWGAETVREQLDPKTSGSPARTKSAADWPESMRTLLEQMEPAGSARG